MTNANSSKTDDRFLANAMASFIQIGALLLLLMLCYKIVSPFIHVVIWGLVISIALYPSHRVLSVKLGGREKYSAVILVLIGLAVIIVPVWLTAESSISAAQRIATDVTAGTVSIPAPRAAVAEWPLVGEQIYALWSSAASNLEATMNTYAPQLRKFGQSIAGFAGGVATGVLQFVFAVIIAGALLLNAESGHRTARNIAASLMGDSASEKITTLSILTIRSVVKGVLGVAAIQAILAGIGLAIMGVPAAGLWAAVVLVTAIVQLPTLLILGPIALWVYSTSDPVPATIFLVYAIFVSVCDAFLKPMLLGRGLDTPMLVILLGAIGGALAMGIIGLFLGAVILAVSYELFVAWMGPDPDPVVADA